MTCQKIFFLSFFFLLTSQLLACGDHHAPFQPQEQSNLDANADLIRRHSREMLRVLDNAHSELESLQQSPGSAEGGEKVQGILDGLFSVTKDTENVLETRRAALEAQSRSQGCTSSSQSSTCQRIKRELDDVAEVEDMWRTNVGNPLSALSDLSSQLDDVRQGRVNPLTIANGVRSVLSIRDSLQSWNLL